MLPRGNGGAPTQCATGGARTLDRVTNAQFAKFVEATGYVTVAEIAPSKSSNKTFRRRCGESFARNQVLKAAPQPVFSRASA